MPSPLVGPRDTLEILRINRVFSLLPVILCECTLVLKLFWQRTFLACQDPYPSIRDVFPPRDELNPSDCNLILLLLLWGVGGVGPQLGLFSPWT